MKARGEDRQIIVYQIPDDVDLEEEIGNIYNPSPESFNCLPILWFD